MNYPHENVPPERGDGRIEELMVRYWDNALTTDELAEFNRALIEQPELRGTFRDLCLQSLGLAERFLGQRAQTQPTGVVRRPLHPVPRVLRSPLRSWVGLAAAAAATLLVGGLAGRLFQPAPHPPESPVIAHVAEVVGWVQLGTLTPEMLPVGREQVIRQGQTISTVGVDSSAQVRYPDGTRLVLGCDTTVTLTDKGAKQVRILDGDLAADIVPQPAGRPMRLVTPEAEVEVQGTKLALTRAEPMTRVGVLEGQASFTRLSDGRTVSMRPGEQATAAPHVELRSQAFPRVGDTLLVTFERQLPADWETGQFVADELPPDSNGAVRAVPHPGLLGQHHQIRTFNAWTQGLCTLHEDSSFHVRFRVDRPGFFHLLVVARTEDPTQRQGIVLEAPPFWEGRAPAQWHTVRLPLSQFRPLTKGRLPGEPLVACLVVLDSQQANLGLSIDRLEVTRGPE